MNKYEPELGQMFFGNDSQEFKVETKLYNALEEIKEFMQSNKVCDKIKTLFGEYHATPFENSGVRFKNKTFECNAYDWNEDNDQQYNFKYKDLEVSWYKYFGRGMSCNKQVDRLFCQKMINDCINSIS